MFLELLAKADSLDASIKMAPFINLFDLKLMHQQMLVNSVGDCMHAPFARVVVNAGMFIFCLISVDVFGGSK